MARALYLATRTASEKDAAAYVKNFAATARLHGLESFLPSALASLPAVMEEIDALHRVTVETATPIDEKTALAALDASGVSTDGVEVVRNVVPDLVGGIRINTKDRVIDGSVRRYMDDLKKTVAK